MDSAIISGSFGVFGTAIGWALSEAGAGWRHRGERRRQLRAEADSRVFAAADAAGSVAEGLRWLVGVDASKLIHGEGVDSANYQATVMQLSLELRRLRQTPLAVSAKGPQALLPQLTALVAKAQVLWDLFEDLPRHEIGVRAQELRAACDELGDEAARLVRLHHA